MFEMIETNFQPTCRQSQSPEEAEEGGEGREACQGKRFVMDMMVMDIMVMDMMVWMIS